MLELDCIRFKNDYGVIHCREENDLTHSYVISVLLGPINLFMKKISIVCRYQK